MNMQNIKKTLQQVNNELNEQLNQLDYYNPDREIILKIRKRNIDTLLKIEEYELKGVLE